MAEYDPELDAYLSWEAAISELRRRLERNKPMNTDTAELIDELKKYSECVEDVNTEIVMQKAISALESQPFDVLQDLNDGKMFVSGRTGNVIFKDVHDSIAWHNTGIILNAWDLLHHTWQPYHEPANGSREWAAEQDCKVTHKSFERLTFSTPDVGKQDFLKAFNDSFFDKGWSLHEPREAGWYLIRTSSDRKNNRMHHWDGKMWAGSENKRHTYPNEYYHWIGKARIELETPS